MKGVDINGDLIDDKGIWDENVREYGLNPVIGNCGFVP
jgi:hypothetical protein